MSVCLRCFDALQSTGDNDNEGSQWTCGSCRTQLVELPPLPAVLDVARRSYLVAAVAGWVREGQIDETLANQLVAEPARELAQLRAGFEHRVQVPISAPAEPAEPVAEPALNDAELHEAPGAREGVVELPADDETDEEHTWRQDAAELAAAAMLGDIPEPRPASARPVGPGRLQRIWSSLRPLLTDHWLYVLGTFLVVASGWYLLSLLWNPLGSIGRYAAVVGALGGVGLASAWLARRVARSHHDLGAATVTFGLLGIGLTGGGLVAAGLTADVSAWMSALLTLPALAVHLVAHRWLALSTPRAKARPPAWSELLTVGVQGLALSAATVFFDVPAVCFGAVFVSLASVWWSLRHHHEVDEGGSAHTLGRSIALGYLPVLTTVLSAIAVLAEPSAATAGWTGVVITAAAAVLADVTTRHGAGRALRVVMTVVPLLLGVALSLATLTTGVLALMSATALLWWQATRGSNVFLAVAGHLSLLAAAYVAVAWISPDILWSAVAPFPRPVAALVPSLVIGVVLAFAWFVERRGSKAISQTLAWTSVATAAVAAAVALTAGAGAIGFDEGGSAPWAAAIGAFWSIGLLVAGHTAKRRWMGHVGGSLLLASAGLAVHGAPLLAATATVGALLGVFWLVGYLTTSRSAVGRGLSDLAVLGALPTSAALLASWYASTGGALWLGGPATVVGVLLVAMMVLESRATARRPLPVLALAMSTVVGLLAVRWLAWSTGVTVSSLGSAIALASLAFVAAELSIRLRWASWARPRALLGLPTVAPNATLWNRPLRHLALVLGGFALVQAFESPQHVAVMIAGAILSAAVLRLALACQSRRYAGLAYGLALLSWLGFGTLLPSSGNLSVVPFAAVGVLGLAGFGSTLGHRAGARWQPVATTILNLTPLAFLLVGAGTLLLLNTASDFVVPAVAVRLGAGIIMAAVGIALVATAGRSRWLCGVVTVLVLAGFVVPLAGSTLRGDVVMVLVAAVVCGLYLVLTGLAHRQIGSVALGPPLPIWRIWRGHVVTTRGLFYEAPSRVLGVVAMVLVGCAGTLVFASEVRPGNAAMTLALATTVVIAQHLPQTGSSRRSRFLLLAALLAAGLAAALAIGTVMGRADVSHPLLMLAVGGAVIALLYRGGAWLCTRFGLDFAAATARAYWGVAAIGSALGAVVVACCGPMHSMLDAPGGLALVVFPMVAIGIDVAASRRVSHFTSVLGGVVLVATCWAIGHWSFGLDALVAIAATLAVVTVAVGVVRLAGSGLRIRQIHGILVATMFTAAVATLTGLVVVAVAGGPVLSTLAATTALVISAATAAGRARYVAMTVSGLGLVAAGPALAAEGVDPSLVWAAGAVVCVGLMQGRLWWQRRRKGVADAVVAEPIWAWLSLPLVALGFAAMSGTTSWEAPVATALLIAAVLWLRQLRRTTTTAVAVVVSLAVACHGSAVLALSPGDPFVLLQHWTLLALACTAVAAVAIGLAGVSPTARPHWRHAGLALVLTASTLAPAALLLDHATASIADQLAMVATLAGLSWLWVLLGTRHQKRGAIWLGVLTLCGLYAFGRWRLGAIYEGADSWGVVDTWVVPGLVLAFVTFRGLWRRLGGDALDRVLFEAALFVPAAVLVGTTVAMGALPPWAFGAAAVAFAAAAWRYGKRWLFVVAVVLAHVEVYRTWIHLDVTDPLWFALPVGLALFGLTALYHRELSRRSTAAIHVVAALVIYLAQMIEILSFSGIGEVLLMAVLAMVGIAAGVVFRLRVPLILGASFLALDVVVNLFRLGLHDRVIGTATLFVTGVVLLAAGVLFSARKDQLRDGVHEIRRELASWR